MFKNTASPKRLKITKDLSGQTFGRLTVQEFAGYRSVGASNSAYWVCLCECGTKKAVQARFLKNGLTVSCGCYQREQAAQVNRKPVEVAGFNRLYRNYQEGAKNRDIEWGLTKEDAKALFGRECRYCGMHPSQGLTTAAGTYVYSGIDRVDNSQGYLAENCVSCCKTCNYAKRSMTHEEFVLWISKVYQHLREAGEVCDL